ncbi:NADH-quinone oxidoreductase subunit K [compost metagenome]
MTIFPMQTSGFALPILQSPLGLPHVLTLAAALFALGLFAALAHRSFLRILMGLELMLLAAMLNLVAFTSYLHPEGLQGHALTLLLIGMAIAQLAVGMAIAAQLMRSARAPQPSRAPEAEAPEAAAATETDPLNVDRYDELRW